MDIIDVDRRVGPQGGSCEVPLRKGTPHSTQEVKALVRPEFEANPDKYYPTETFRKLGFSRAQCKCGHFFWRKSEEVTTCGDSK